MVETFPSERPDQSFRKTVLPRRIARALTNSKAYNQHKEWCTGPTTKIEFTDKSAGNFFVKLGIQQAQYENELEELKRENKHTLPSKFRLIRRYPLGAAASIGIVLLSVVAGLIWSSWFDSHFHYLNIIVLGAILVIVIFVAAMRKLVAERRLGSSSK
jgi:hypothetical protein